MMSLLSPLYWRAGGVSLPLTTQFRNGKHNDRRHVDRRRNGNGRLTPPARLAPRRAFTLVELLIVVAIMVVIAAFLIPAVRPALQDRKIRESARLVNVFFAGAQARAIERGRPVGVWLERNPTSPDECVQLFMAEAPLPYSGDLMGAQAFVDYLRDGMNNPMTNPTNGNLIYRAVLDGNSFSLPFLIRVLDQIKFDYKGPAYTITSVNAASGPNPAYVTFEHNNGRVPPVPMTVPYQIFRQPTRSSATTFSLPSSTSINLYYSGAGTDGFGTLATDGGGVLSPQISNYILVTFNSAGRLDRIISEGVTVQATESIYFFVARNDKVDAAQAPDIYGFQNLEDASNLWVTVGHNTGAVMTVENVSTLGMPYGTFPEQVAKVIEARRFAREKASMGGR